jgi:hypothetical protein
MAIDEHMLKDVFNGFVARDYTPTPRFGVNRR